MTELLSDYAIALDDRDPLPTLRGEFHVPVHDGAEQEYFCCNSLYLCNIFFIYSV